jgi:hypothetical protein
MAQADIVNLSTKPDGTFNWGNAMRGAMSTIASADLETVESRLASSFGLIYTVDPALCTTLSGITTANRGVYGRVVGSGSVSKIGLEIGASSGNICVAVYRNTGTGRTSAPGTRLATSGSVACPSTGFAEVALGATVDVQQGDWFYIGADNTTATFRVVHTTGAANGLAAGRWAFADANFPAPASPTPSAGFNRGYCLVGIA